MHVVCVCVELQAFCIFGLNCLLAGRSDALENGPITRTGPTGPTGSTGPTGPYGPLRAFTDLTGPLRAPYGHSGTYGPLATVQKLT